MGGREMAEEIKDGQALRTFYGDPNFRAARKQMPKLDKHTRHFISLSPFLVLSTAGDNGTDASPRGDAPGFVAVIDDETIVIPDRLGNNRVDSMTNIMENPNVGMLFLVPGIKETLRVNGKASVTTDPALLESMAVRGKIPRSGLVIKVEEVYLHCAKALIRSKLWDPETQVERSAFPTMGQVFKDQIDEIDDADQADREIQEGYVTRLY
jgi:PPOX class probable FMN-dependent enzyme